MPRRLIALSLALGLVVALLPAAPAVGTVGWTTWTLAAGVDTTDAIAISGDRVVWAQDEGDTSDQEIWTCVIGDTGPENVSDRPGEFDVEPAVDGNRIAWAGQTNMGRDIFTWAPGDVTPTQVTFDGFRTDKDVQVSGNRLFWSGANELAEPDLEIYTWVVGDAAPTNISNNPGVAWNDEGVRVSGDRVVWTGFDGTDREIYTWAVSDPVRRNLSNNTWDDQNPEIDGDLVVWDANAGSDYEVYGCFVGESAFNVSNRVGEHDYAPSVSGTRIVWEAEVPPSSDCDIFMFEIGDAAPTNITNTPDVYDSTVTISGDHMVWVADEASDSEVYVWSEALGAVNLSNNTTTDYDPAISGTSVAWLNHNSDPAYSVMAAKLVPTALTAVPVAGETRIGTAIEASKLAFADDSVETVVIATAYNWPDALGGAALAGAVGGPILLTAAGDLPADVAAEIDRLGATEAIILGGEAAVDAAVLDELEGLLGLGNVDRIGGDDRYETARMIAAAVVAELGVAYDGTAFAATGANFPDALGASPLAAANGWPIYLVNPALGADATLIAAMQADGVADLLVLGGEAVVSADAESGLAAGVPCTTDRLAGDNRYETACDVATYGITDGGLSWNRLAIATGTDFPDALAGGVMQGRAGSVLLLTPGTSLDAGVAAILTANASVIDEVRFLGGTAAVTDVVRDAVATALGY